MSVSQNCIVEGLISSDDESSPAGLDFLGRLSQFLLDHEWRCTGPESWRDIGWSLSVQRDYQRLQVTFSTTSGTSALIQVAPEHSPGWLGRLFGGTSSASENDVQRLAEGVHRFLSLEGYESQRWGWDGYPTEGSWEPVLPWATPRLPVRPPRPVTTQEKEVLERVLGLIPDPKDSLAAARRSISGLNVVARCPCGCASVDFATGEGKAAQRVLADAIGESEDGCMVGVMIWGNASTATAVEVYSLEGQNHGVVGLPKPETIRLHQEKELV